MKQTKEERIIAELIKENDRQAQRIRELERTRFVRFKEEDCWVYQGDGSDHLESLVCPVMIDPKKLIELGG